MQPIETPLAPKAIGPYAQAIACGEWLFCSGQIALDPRSGELVGKNAAEQARRALENLKGVLEAGGSGLRRVVKTTVFLKSLADFPAMNEVYGAAFGDHRPARSTIEAAALPRGALVEIEAIALRNA